MEQEQQVAWLATKENAPVIDADGNEVGRVDLVLGDDDDNIFHGLAVKLEHRRGVVEIPGAKVDRITSERVYTTLTAAEIESLEPYEESNWYDFEGLKGILRKRVRWEEDE